ncbi:hypothetical protein GOODEAATRI_014943, partial [Goodea atripinnis]
SDSLDSGLSCSSPGRCYVCKLAGKRACATAALWCYASGRSGIGSRGVAVVPVLKRR